MNKLAFELSHRNLHWSSTSNQRSLHFGTGQQKLTEVAFRLRVYMTEVKSTVRNYSVKLNFLWYTINKTETISSCHVFILKLSVMVINSHSDSQTLFLQLVNHA